MRLTKQDKIDALVAEYKRMVQENLVDIKDKIDTEQLLILFGLGIQIDTLLDGGHRDDWPIKR